VEQWEKRTREKWPDEGLLFLSYKDNEGKWLPWIVASYRGVKAYLIKGKKEYKAFCIPNSKKPPKERESE
jgi:hypothetical protein